MSDSVDTTGSEEDLKNYVGPEGTVLRWLKEIEIVKESDKQKTFEEVLSDGQ